MNLVIDVGNTRVKLAVFKEFTLLETFLAPKENFLLKVKDILNARDIRAAILSNVASVENNVLEYLKSKVVLTVVSSTLQLPFINKYKTPETLGADRIALVAAAQHLYYKQNVLIIDAGTCITYDFLTKGNEYLGGAIAPGIKMRFQALHHFTSKLPLLKQEALDNFIGDSTNTAINSGVVNGVIQEIDGVINQYREQFLDFTIVLTGGDTNFLGKQLKNSIFANQNFLLEGLNTLLIYNKSK